MMKEAKMMSTRREDEDFLSRLTRGTISSLSFVIRVSRSTRPHWKLYGPRDPSL